MRRAKRCEIDMPRMAYDAVCKIRRSAAVPAVTGLTSQAEIACNVTNTLIMVCVAAMCATAGCEQSPMPADGERSRTYRLGFSAIPPKPDVSVALAAIELWAGRRADAAIMHMDVPWEKLLSGKSAEVALQEDGIELAQHYRARDLSIVFTIDATDGLARDREAPALRAAGRSIVEPEVQRLYREFAVAVARLIRPDYLGLAAETNLIRAAAPQPVYDALVQMVNAAALEVRALNDRPPLYVSVQVETAWGRLGGSGTFAGIEQDLRDFPLSDALGLSSYPYLGGFDEPEDVPLDYYERVGRGSGLPVLVVEGGWASASSPIFNSSPAKQARWIHRQMDLLDAARAVAAFQLTFTDLDVSTFPQPVPDILPLFASLGLVDTELRAKPALASWDSIFARPFAN